MKTLLRLCLGLGIFLLPVLAQAAAPPAPVGVNVSSLQPDNSAILHWNNDPVAIRWYVYYNGTQTAQVTQSQAGYDASGQRNYVLFNLPKTAPTVIITMRSTYAGPLSAESNAVTLTTGTAPTNIMYVRTDPAFPLDVSGTGGGGGGTVYQGTTPWVVSGNVTVTGITVTAYTSVTNPVSVIQASPWTVSGSVSVDSLPSAYQGVTIASAIDLNVLQASPWTVSGSVQVTNFPMAYQGVTIASAVNLNVLQASPWTVSGSVQVSSSPPVIQGSPWTVSGSVTVDSLPAVVQGSPWTVSGSVQVTNFPMAYQGVTLAASNINLGVTQASPWTVSGSATVSQGSPWTVSGSVTVDSLPAVVQGSPWTVSGSVQVTNFPMAYQGVTIASAVNLNVLQASPWTVSGSVQVTSLPAAYTGVTIASAVNLNVLQASPWTVSGSAAVTAWPAAYLGVSVVSSVNHGVTQSSPWTVSGSVSVTNFPTAYYGVTLAASNINLGVTQASPWTVSGSAAVTAWPAAYLGVSVVAALPSGGNNIGSVNAVESGTWNVTVNTALPTGGNNIGSVNAVQSGTWAMSGDVASGSADSGNPLKIGGVGRTTNPAAVADGQRVNSFFTKTGKIVVVQDAPRELRIKGALDLTWTAESTVIAAQGSGVFVDIYGIALSNNSNTETKARLSDSTGGGDYLEWDLAPNGGNIAVCFNPPLPQTTANNNWTVQLSNSPTGGGGKIHTYLFGVKNN